MWPLLMTSPSLIPLVNITNPKAWQRHIHISEAWLHRLLETMSRAHPCPQAQVSFLFTSNRTMRTLNKTHRGLDKPTNVLSFPGDLEDNLHPCLGDIALGLECILKESRELDVSFEAHLSRMVIHGILHLLGFDHETQKERGIMERHEAKLLRALDFKNYPFEDQQTL
jgi:probable rRNA maturation factor